MTNASVKDVASLLNYVGSSQAVTKNSMNQAGSFGDVMNRASGNDADLFELGKSTGSQPAKKTADSLEHSKAMKKTSVVQSEKLQKTDSTTSQKEAVEKAGEKAVKEIAKELGVSEEDVVKAMEEMGISAAALFDQATLTQLVLQLTGETDPMALLTDEGLFGQLQNLLDTLGTIQENLMQELDLNPDELQSLLQEMEAAGQNVAEEEAAPKITVEIEVNGETVQASADENGNLEKTLTVTSKKENEGQQETGHQNKEAKGQQDGSVNAGNQMMDTMLQNKVQTAEVSFEQTTLFSQNTQEIMDQILDYMKIQLKPGMDQLQMQLHPESLGTVHVQLTSKGGEITAQFQVQNETVKAAIESQITELKEALKDQGVKIEAVEVTVENRGFDSNLWQGKGQEENATSQGNKKSPRRINLNDLDALFEEEAAPEDVLAAKMMEVNGNTVDYTA